MSTVTKLLIAAGFVLVVGYIVYSSMGFDQISCEVCVEFRGNTDCRTASGSTREEAMRTAIDTACAQLASGMTDSIACSQTAPKSVECRER